MALCSLWIEFDSFLVIRDRAIIVLSTLLGTAAVVIRSGVVGSQLNDLAEVGDCVGVGLPTKRGAPTLEVGPGVFWIDRNGSVVIR